MGWNKSQEQAITGKGDILVSASAGSGKTTVMIARIIDQIKNGVPINRMLILTFSNLASFEMKEKIRKELIKQAKKDLLNNKLFKEQLDLLPFSQISTIHSFCSQLVKGYFEFLNINPSFEIINEIDSEIYKHKAFDKMVEFYDSNQDRVFIELVKKFAATRKMQEFYNIIIGIYNNMTVQVDKDFITKLVNKQYTAEGIANIENVIITDTEKSANRYYNKFLEFNDFFVSNGDEKNSKVANCGLDILEPFRKITSLKELSNYVNSLVIKFPNKNKKAFADYDENLLKEFEFYLAGLKKFLKNLSVYSDYDDLKEKYNRTNVVVLKLIEATKLFDKEYSNIKNKENKLDYSDLERYTIRLLKEPKYEQEIKEKYDFIYVDEYQDTNPIQEYLISKIAKENSTFFVGDVKQSIFSFRLCEPKIILSRYESYKKDGNGQAIDLNCNYRSDEKILDFVNLIFNVIMTKDSSDIDYLNTSKLKLDSEFKKLRNSTIKAKIESEQKCKLVLINEPDKEKINYDYKNIYSVKNHKYFENTVKDKGFYQAKYVIEEIKKIVNNKKIVENGEERFITYSDIAILSRSKCEECIFLKEYFEQNDIPINAIKFKDNTNKDNILAIDNLLKVAYNLKQDIPLASTMIGYFGNFDEQELADIKLNFNNQSNKTYFYEAVLNQAKFDTKLGKKVKEFLKFLNSIKFKASNLKVADLINVIIKETGYDEYLLVQPQGNIALQNLNAYIEQISSNENLLTLTDYLEFVDMDAEIEIENSGEQGKNAVSLMTMHASKGLEYPVVFIINIDKNFFFKDLNETLLFNNQLGVGLLYFNHDTYKKEDTILINALKILMRNNKLKEEIRIFYVALTRAKNYLYMVGNNNKAFDSPKFSPLECKSYLEMLAIVNQKDDEFKSFIEYVDYESQEIEKKENTIKFSKPDLKYQNRLQEVFSYSYPYIDSTKLLYKHTATSINQLQKNNFITSDENEVAKLGTLYHLIMEKISFNCYSIEDIEEELNRLIEEKIIDIEQANQIDKRVVLKCLNTKSLKFAKSNTMFKEKEFNIKCKANELLDTNVLDDIMVQGIIDLFVKGDKNLLIDYKFSSKNAENLVKSYKNQFKVYETAVKVLFNVKIDKKIIINLKNGEEIEVL